MNVNKAILVGRVGADPIVRETAKGDTVCNVSLATNSGYGDNEKVDWHKVTFFGKLADTVNQYVTKGMKVYVEGRLKSSTYNTQDGESRFRNEINANDIRFLDRRGAGGSQEETAGGDTGEQSSGGVEDLPW